MHHELSPHAWKYLEEMERFDGVLGKTEFSPVARIVRSVQLGLAVRRVTKSTERFLNAVLEVHPNESVFNENTGVRELKDFARILIRPDATDRVGE